MTIRIIPVVILLACPLAFSQATQPATQPSEDGASSSSKTLTADQMLSQMLKPDAAPSRPLQPAAEPVAADKTSGRGAVMPNAPTVNVLREGTYVVDRVGRLTKSPDGSQSAFTFESDGKALRDPPLIILPNLKLMAMENAVTGANRDLRFRMTGMVTEYHGRNYVLLEKIVVIPDVTQQF